MTPAHAATTLTITDCSSDSQLQADVSTANSDNAGDTITFSCSGDIPLSQTLGITGNMTIDGNGQSVTLDGNNSVQVLSVNSGVSLTLNALTITKGASGDGGGLLNSAGNVSISNSTFVNNTSYGGGGLYNNGGTVSISNSALQQGSPAIDAVPLSANICSSTDQRGNPRPDDPSETACDMGAYESNYSSLTLTGTTVNATEGVAFSGTVASGTYSGSGTLSASITWVMAPARQQGQ